MVMVGIESKQCCLSNHACIGIHNLSRPSDQIGSGRGDGSNDWKDRCATDALVEPKDMLMNEPTVSECSIELIASDYACGAVDSIEHGSLNSLSNMPKIVFNLRFGDRLRFLEKRAQHVQYQLACLSTLGGAYHLCNDPRAALVIARRQEVVGRALGAVSIVVRSRVFQAVNFAQLGKPGRSRRAFAQCKTLALRQSCGLSSSLLAFIEASEQWVVKNVHEQIQCDEEPQH